MEYCELFAMRIRSLCQKRGITINMLASFSGLNQSTVNNIVSGTSRNPTVRTLHLIANAFNMTLSEFLDFAELNAYDFDEEDPE